MLLLYCDRPTNMHRYSYLQLSVERNNRAGETVSMGFQMREGHCC